ncbi:MAG: manganese-dependent inorganic pyrophosphatase [Clostridia bacterium]|nr:manganese-dependent inorganic pyrophosphatase [Clostridia bacterium]
MNKILIFGHKNPDTDSICSALIMEQYDKKLGCDVEAVRLGDINKETVYVLEYLHIEAPRLIESVEEGQEVVLVDHNEFPQSVNNIENAKITAVVDHHRICDFKTADPLYYRAEPVGSTATVLYKKFKESDMEISKEIATLMVSAIISDTLLFKSPTCTSEDVEIANKLALIAGIDMQEYGLNLLKAGTDLSDVSEEKLINLDAKEVMLGNIKAVIAQVNTASIPDMMTRKEKIEQEIKKAIKDRNLDLFLFAITDIINSNSQAIVLGNKADIVSGAYHVTLENNTVFLEGVVSRKKQIIPVLTEASKK